jgi:hypothetical protein
MFHQRQWLRRKGITIHLIQTLLSIWLLRIVVVLQAYTISVYPTGSTFVGSVPCMEHSCAVCRVDRDRSWNQCTRTSSWMAENCTVKTHTEYGIQYQTGIRQYLPSMIGTFDLRQARNVPVT